MGSGAGVGGAAASGSAMGSMLGGSLSALPMLSSMMPGGVAGQYRDPTRAGLMGGLPPLHGMGNEPMAASLAATLNASSLEQDMASIDELAAMDDLPEDLRRELLGSPVRPPPRASPTPTSPLPHPLLPPPPHLTSFPLLPSGALDQAHPSTLDILGLDASDATKHGFSSNGGGGGGGPASRVPSTGATSAAAATGGGGSGGKPPQKLGGLKLQRSGATDLLGDMNLNFGGGEANGDGMSDSGSMETLDTTAGGSGAASPRVTKVAATSSDASAAQAEADRHVQIITAAEAPYHIVWASEAWLSLCEFTNGQVLGQTLEDIQGRLTDRAALASLMGAIKAGTALQFQMVNTLPSGRPSPTHAAHRAAPRLRRPRPVLPGHVVEHRPDERQRRRRARGCGVPARRLGVGVAPAQYGGDADGERRARQLVGVQAHEL